MTWSLGTQLTVISCDHFSISCNQQVYLNNNIFFSRSSTAVDSADTSKLPEHSIFAYKDVTILEEKTTKLTKENKQK